MAINKALIIGHVGKDPEIRTMTNGNNIATFSLATTESWKDKTTGEKKEKTEWHRIVVYSSGLANIVKQYVKKGTKLYIEGQLQTRKWTGTDGIDRYATEIVLQGFNAVLQILDSIKSSEERPLTKEEAKNTFSEASFIDNDNIIDENEFIDEKIDDDIPF